MRDIFIIIIVLATSIITRLYLDINPIQIKEDTIKNDEFSNRLKLHKM